MGDISQLITVGFRKAKKGPCSIWVHLLPESVKDRGLLEPSAACGYRKCCLAGCAAPWGENCSHWQWTARQGGRQENAHYDLFLLQVPISCCHLPALASNRNPKRRSNSCRPENLASPCIGQGEDWVWRGKQGIFSIAC